MENKRILWIIVIILGMTAALYIFINRWEAITTNSNTPVDQVYIPENLEMYPTQEECEKKTAWSCSNDLLCDDKCPQGFHKGWWAPSSSEQNCAQEGQTLGAQGMPDSCCSGLKRLWGHPGWYSGDCSALPVPGGLSMCSRCGDTICNKDTGENKCNCTEDCL